MRARLLIVPVLVATLAGCGYVDDNPHAVQVVAQSYLDSLRRHDLAGVCRVLAPEVQAAIAAGGTCEGALPAHLRKSYPRLQVGTAHEVDGPPGNPRFDVVVPAQAGVVITVGRYGSIWRVVGAGGLVS
jgi:hypothetical protein